MNSEEGGQPERRVGRWQAIGWPIAILIACCVVGFVLIETGPTAERQTPVRTARLVEVVPVRKTAAATRIDAMGTVVATRQVVIQPQVSGRIVEVSPEFQPGGHFEPGAVMLRIDPSDYELAVRQRQAELDQAKANLKIESGNQSVARLEFELLGETVTNEDRDLVLRQPQLATVRAQVAAAEAALERARLDLDRTVVRAPFHALVRERGAELGARVDPSTSLATLVDTSAYWVEVAVPTSQLRWIEIPTARGTAGSAAWITDVAAWGRGAGREGRVVRLLGDLETEGRMARVLVRVDDPLGFEPKNAEAPVLLLDSFVGVRLIGQALDDIVELDRSLLRDDDRVWVMGEGGRLDIREVDVAFRGSDRVLIRAGLHEGERLVVSDLSGPVAGMALRTPEAEEAPMEATPDVIAEAQGGSTHGS